MRGLTQRSQYALRAVYELSQHRGRGPVPARVIARAQAIPQRYLEKILEELRRHGLVRSYRGTHGGYELSQNPTDIPVGRILRIFGANLALVKCQLCGGESFCALTSQCIFADLWRQATQRLVDLFDHTTIADLSQQPDPEDRCTCAVGSGMTSGPPNLQSR